MNYAEVAVNSPLAQRKAFSYAIPVNMELYPGQPVWVPFGSSLRQGIVLELTDNPSLSDTAGIKEITAVIDTQTVLSSHQIQLARWISDYYLAPLFESLALMLPPGFEKNQVTFIQLVSDIVPLPSLSIDQKFILDMLKTNTAVNIKTIEKSLGKSKADRILTQMQNKGLVSRIHTPNMSFIKPREELYMKLTIGIDVAYQEATKLDGKKARRQAELLRFLADKNRPVRYSELSRNIPATSSLIRALEKKKFISTSSIRVQRNRISQYTSFPASPPALSTTQEIVWKKIESHLIHPHFKTFLLHGINGSGKTEIYMHALSNIIAQGKRGIVLVPEISLTPQTIACFTSRFPDQVAVFHSKLTRREQFDEWLQIKEGLCNVVIGARGAIFAPQPDLGLIILDEEHEWTYKQQDQMPRYHAREVARVLAKLNDATLILGSATPDIESYYHSTTGKYELLTLPEKFTLNGKPQLPEIEIVDMRQELKTGNSSIFSRQLRSAIEKSLEAKEQIILFLNRRGTSTFVQCRECGFVLRCNDCNVAFTHHAARNELICHHCNRHIPVPDICPKCGSKKIKFLGLGTEGLLQKTAQTFPEAKIMRWDKDVTMNRYSHEKLMSQFNSHKADILVGTQMIAKGLDFPSVSLVGVISADTILTLPDIRASERTFQLLSQVAGRAGRGNQQGKAIIQTYNPQHYAITALSKNDYSFFYKKEIAYRHQFLAPPFRQLARLVYINSNEFSCQKETRKISRLLGEKIKLNKLSDMQLIGPAPAYLYKIKDKFRWQIIIRGNNISSFLANIEFPPGWTIDVDPVSLL